MQSLLVKEFNYSINFSNENFFFQLLIYLFIYKDTDMENFS